MDPKNSTEHKSGKNKPGFSSFKKKDDEQFYFRFVGEDGQLILNSNAYSDSDKRKAGLKMVRENAANLSRFKRVEKEGLFHFVIRAGNNRALAKSIAFHSKEDLEKAIQQTHNAAKIEETPTPAVSVSKPESHPKLTISPAESQEQEEQTRFNFDLTFYLQEKGEKLIGKIEYPLDKERASFEGFDTKKIQEFLLKHLPEKFQAIEEAKREKTVKEKAAVKATPPKPEAAPVQKEALAQKMEKLPPKPQVEAAPKEVSAQKAEKLPPKPKVETVPKEVLAKKAEKLQPKSPIESVPKQVFAQKIKKLQPKPQVTPGPKEVPAQKMEKMPPKPAPIEATKKPLKEIKIREQKTHTLKLDIIENGQLASNNVIEKSSSVVFHLEIPNEFKTPEFQLDVSVYAKAMGAGNNRSILISKFQKAPSSVIRDHLRIPLNLPSLAIGVYRFVINVDFNSISAQKESRLFVVNRLVKIVVKRSLLEPVFN